MDLTPAEVAEFEKRAEAGEKPVHPGWKDTWERPFFNVQSCKRLLNYAVLELRDKRGGATDWMLVDDAERIGSPPFASLTAAQLLAESLLRRATAPLHHSVDVTDMIRRDVALKAMVYLMGETAQAMALICGTGMTDDFGGEADLQERLELAKEALARAESEAGK